MSIFQDPTQPDPPTDHSASEHDPMPRPDKIHNWTYPKNGSTNNQEGMSEPSRHDKLLSIRYIPNCAEIVAPITELTKNKMPNVVKWGDKQEEAFTKIVNPF